MFQQRFLSIPSSNGDHYLPPCLCKPLLFRYYYPPTCKALLSPLKNTTSLHPIPAKLQPLPANTETLHTTHKFYKLQKEMTFILEGIPRRQCFSSFTDLKLTKCCHPIHFHSKTSSVEVQLRCMKQHFYSRQIALVWKVGMGTLTTLARWLARNPRLQVTKCDAVIASGCTHAQPQPPSLSRDASDKIGPRCTACPLHIWSPTNSMILIDRLTSTKCRDQLGWRYDV